MQQLTIPCYVVTSENIESLRSASTETDPDCLVLFSKIQSRLCQSGSLTLNATQLEQLKRLLKATAEKNPGTNLKTQCEAVLEKIKYVEALSEVSDLEKEVLDKLRELSEQ